MASGRLASDNRPLITVEVDGLTIEAVIDTGFDGGVQLPDHLLPVLNPPFISRVPFQYPNGQIDWRDTHRVRVVVGGEDTDAVAIFSPNDEVVLGLELLQHFRLTIDFPAGTVELAR